jgi:hypothetical protein
LASTAVVGLAAMRDAVARLGGDPWILNPAENKSVKKKNLDKQIILVLQMAAGGKIHLENENLPLNESAGYADMSSKLRTCQMKWKCFIDRIR